MVLRLFAALKKKSWRSSGRKPSANHSALIGKLAEDSAS